MSKVILKFDGLYEFLSNFALSEATYEDYTYITVEHAYQAAKTNNQEHKISIRQAATPGRAKKIGRHVELIPSWNEVKFDVMLGLLRKKFSNRELASKLLATGNDILVEGNTWHDNIWGVCYCPECCGEGQNNLGKLLMKVREELKNKEELNFYKKHSMMP